MKKFVSIFKLWKTIHILAFFRGYGGQVLQREICHSVVFIPYMATAQGLDKAKAKMLELQLGLPCVCQGPKHLGHLALLFPGPWARSWIEVEQ